MVKVKTQFFNVTYDRMVKPFNLKTEPISLLKLFKLLIFFFFKIILLSSKFFLCSVERQRVIFSRFFRHNIHEVSYGSESKTFDQTDTTFYMFRMNNNFRL